MKLSFLTQLNQKINAHAAQYVHPYITFAIFGMVTYPLFYIIWRLSDAHGYDSLELRLIATSLCVILACNHYWPIQLKKYLPLFWYATLLYCLPFLFTYLLLKNHMTYDWSMNTMTVLVLCLLLLDPIALYIILFTGIASGVLFYWVQGNAIVVHQNYIAVLVTYASILIFGSLFSYRQAQLRAAEEKLNAIEAEHLKLEISARNAQLENQLQLTKITNQVAHDIRSPLASLSMIVKSCIGIPEMQRIALREAAASINDIANNLLSQYKMREKDTTHATEPRQPVLVSALLLQFVTDKKYEYQDKRIKFVNEIWLTGQFSFVHIDPASLRRSLSNLVNNAVDSFEDHEGIITIRLEADATQVKIVIEDNGQGIPSAIVEKILQNIPVTQNKANGHGIGLTQVHEMLDKSQGNISIESIEEKGTKITLTLPKIEAPMWIADTIQLHVDSIVVILDDDHSIHVAWDSRFETLIKAYPLIRVHHFETYMDALSFLQSLSPLERARVLLLTDYELVKQTLNGLDVVEKSRLPQSILVTSHYANADVQARAVKLNTKILPKQLASEIPLTVEIIDEADVMLKQVDAIWLDDDEQFTKNLKLFVFEKKRVDFFNDPTIFLNDVILYSKNTRIYLDNHYQSSIILRGVDIAAQLHDMGFMNLTLVTGDIFAPNELPDYLNVILKSDIDRITEDWE